MASLTGCIKKLGKNVSAEDRAAIQTLAAQMRNGGMDAQQAAAAAVRAQMDSLAESGKALKAEAQSATAPAPAAAQPAPAEAAATSLDQALARKLAVDQPDLQVVLPGSEERITVAEAMKRIAEEQKQDGQWADLVKVAAECALSTG